MTKTVKLSCIKLGRVRGKKLRRGTVAAFFVKYCTYYDLLIELSNSSRYLNSSALSSCVNQLFVKKKEKKTGKE